MEIAMFVNNIISKEGNRGAFPPDIFFDFVRTDDSVKKIREGVQKKPLNL